MVYGHVVGHEIENESDIRALESLAKPLERRFAAELGIERTVIHDVVAVAAAGARLQERRGIEMTDAERLQVGHCSRGIVKSEILGQLQAIGGERDRGRHQSAPMPQSTAHGAKVLMGSSPQIGR